MLSVRPSVRLSGVTLRQGDRLGKATSIVITRIFSEVRYLKSLFARRRSAIWCKGNTLTFGVEGSVGPTSRYPEFMFLNKLSGKKTINSYAKTRRLAAWTVSATEIAFCRRVKGWLGGSVVRALPRDRKVASSTPGQSATE